MTVTFLQTADPIFYYPMLMETAKTVRSFCIRNGFGYEQYVGIKRGHMPWQSSYNRIYLLKEMVDRGVQGWVFYLDADAFIRDMDFDLASYLEERATSAAIFAGFSTCELPYDVNSGGFALNLSHPVARALVLDWYQSVACVSDREFDNAVHWEDLGNDQHLLCLILEKYLQDPNLAASLLFERANRSYVNNGPFISQFLRSMFPDFSTRFAAVKDRVSTILADAGEAEAGAPGVFMRTNHPKIVSAVGRKGLRGIRSTGERGGLMFGPYISLQAGQYVARVNGEVRLAPGQADVHVHGDVAINRGFAVPAAIDLHFTAPMKGQLLELPFDLDENTESLEVRIVVGEGADIDLHSMQIVAR